MRRPFRTSAPPELTAWIAGAWGDLEEDYMVRHFSDYSANQMQHYVEDKVLFWDDDCKGYYHWNAV